MIITPLIIILNVISILQPHMTLRFLLLILQIRILFQLKICLWHTIPFIVVIAYLLENQDEYLDPREISQGSGNISELRGSVFVAFFKYRQSK